MNYRLVILLQAQKEMADAVDWYEEQQIGLGERFIVFVEGFLRRIVQNPLHFPEKKTPFREAYVKDFPYLIIYRVYNDEVVVYSVFHTKQSPKKKYL
ncbi:type II toxin-antitoxin system RelE/ParE family toxin [Sphingobacterium sp. SGG-5]|uniref:type II toxin-antitoxin system RelE/ParE family toxin n=1 Tax=Sphingobacterium sp. SGG-5 TaxID=2710881 RepID=UPI0013EE1C21|nr:type II toxin-antitoxin system RelE/ParE family toxin [Sphingobacterium sp. SGG-5]NGM61256.1 type II toxin-antitoxin system RelE/ParE family toxin [Sphingobacterium sp. SGG-5]